MEVLGHFTQLNAHPSNDLLQNWIMHDKHPYIIININIFSLFYFECDCVNICMLAILLAAAMCMNLLTFYKQIWCMCFLMMKSESHSTRCAWEESLISSSYLSSCVNAIDFTSLHYCSEHTCIHFCCQIIDY